MIFVFKIKQVRFVSICFPNPELLRKQKYKAKPKTKLHLLLNLDLD